ncbi:hypothetical protein [Paludibacterium paludis]|uniref:Chorismate lyase n=1 Tax=Paludibacterium paludis TaxID=1225769 RepID=A0A918UBB5_9NEIS|nr:hypothetical protein [Paludibacterium paludis]GGY28327.1 hypothetical protein GCM10011289_34460 [Paludibacterium paludis]
MRKLMLVLLGLAMPCARAEDSDGRALLRRFNEALMASHSATRTLEAWCRDRHLAPAPRIVADRDLSVRIDADEAIRRRLAVSASEPVKYRRVALRCGQAVLSIADNWYVPARLTAAMNTALDTSDTPFGAAIAALSPVRVPLSVEEAWPATEPEAPAVLLRHRTLLTLPNGQPISLVVENYQKALLGPSAE